jgi:glycopeptide antibiotics resistance protein
LYIKLIFRPYLPIPNYFQPFLNIGPNLIGCILIPFATDWWLKKYWKLSTTKNLQTVCILGLIMVIINEYLQLFPIFRRTFDYQDILFSFVGIIIGYFSFIAIKEKKFVKN